MGTQNKAHKQTAWKKNREFGDKMGGRGRLKLDDNIFAREHSFHAPTELDEVPILMIDNTSRDYYFPVSPDEIKTALSNLPNSDIVTHIWLRKHNKKGILSLNASKGVAFILSPCIHCWKRTVISSEKTNLWRKIFDGIVLLQTSLKQRRVGMQYSPKRLQRISIWIGLFLSEWKDYRTYRNSTIPIALSLSPPFLPYSHLPDFQYIAQIFQPSRDPPKGSRI